MRSIRARFAGAARGPGMMVDRVWSVPARWQCGEIPPIRRYGPLARARVADKVKRGVSTMEEAVGDAVGSEAGRCAGDDFTHRRA